MSRPALVLTSVGSPKAAAELARSLLSERLCACVSIVPRVRSLYRWKGKLCDERETLLVIKTVREKVAAVRRAFDRLHPYEVPEFLALDATSAGSYERWLKAETTRQKVG